MRRTRPLKFPTLVVFICLSLVGGSVRAAVNQPSPDFQEPAPRDEAIPDPATDAIKRREVDIAPIARKPKSPDEEVEYFHRFRKGLTLRAGAFTGNIDHGGTAGVIFTFRSFLGDAEAGADLQFNNEGALHIARRFNFSQTRFRPFLKAGLGVRVIPDQELVTFLKIQNYQLRAGLGFEQLVRHAQSLRFDLEVWGATETREALATLGYVWAW